MAWGSLRSESSTCSLQAASSPTGRCCWPSPERPPATARAAAPGPATDWNARATEFFTTIADAYAALAKAEPDRIRVLDATRPPREVLAQALKALQDLL